MNEPVSKKVFGQKHVKSGLKECSVALIKTHLDPTTTGHGPTITGHPIKIIHWLFNGLLVGGLVAIFYFPINIGLLSSSQLTNSYFSEGWPWPTNQDWLKGTKFYRTPPPAIVGKIPMGFSSDFPADDRWMIRTVHGRFCSARGLGPFFAPSGTQSPLRDQAWPRDEQIKKVITVGFFGGFHDQIHRKKKVI